MRGGGHSVSEAARDTYLWQIELHSDWHRGSSADSASKQLIQTQHQRR